MVKRLSYFIVFISSLAFGNSIDYAVISLLGGQEFKENQKFIQRLFVKEQNFTDENGNANIYKVAKTLKANGLLKLSFQGPKELEASFFVEGNPATFVNVLHNVLNAMGYYYFMTKKSVLENGDYSFTLAMNTEYAIDPVLLFENLNKYGYKITNIQKQSLTQWDYQIIEQGFKYPKAMNLELDSLKNDLNLSGEYWYKINTGKSLEINSPYKTWYPKIAFYNGNLELIDIVLEEKAMKKFIVEIPQNVVYIKITDKYVPSNVKGGLSVMLKSQK